MADGSPAGVSGLGGDEQGWMMVNWVENPTRRLLAGPVSSGASSDVSSLTHAMPSSISSIGQRRPVDVHACPPISGMPDSRPEHK